MCGRYGFGYQQVNLIYERWDIEDRIADLKANFNAAPSQSLPVVTEGKDGKNHLELMRWGLIPSWASDGKFASINARADTVATKSSFAKPLKLQRCLVPASYFFEWKQTKEGKVPYLIKLKHDELFSLAGLYDINEKIEGKPIRTYAIITTDPNELMEDIHSRMPVILKKSDEKIWLDPSITEPSKVLSMLKPYPANLMEAYPVSSLVNKPENNFPEITNPLK